MIGRYRHRKTSAVVEVTGTGYAETGGHEGVYLRYITASGPVKAGSTAWWATHLFNEHFEATLDTSGMIPNPDSPEASYPS